MPGPVLGAEQVPVAKATLAVPPKMWTFSGWSSGWGVTPQEPDSHCTGVLESAPASSCEMSRILQPDYATTSSLKLHQNIGTADISECRGSEPAAAPGAGSSAHLCPGLPCDPPVGPSQVLPARTGSCVCPHHADMASCSPLGRLPLSLRLKLPSQCMLGRLPLRDLLGRPTC